MIRNIIRNKQKTLDEFTNYCGTIEKDLKKYSEVKIVDMVEVDKMDQKLEIWKKDLLDRSANSAMVNLQETLQTLIYPKFLHVFNDQGSF